MQKKVKVFSCGVTFSVIIVVVQSTDMSNEQAAEQEFLKMLIRVCQTVRNPKNKRNRVVMSIPAARWEATFNERVEEIAHGKVQS